MPVDIRVRDVCERDIDLLLLEEFTSSPAFLNWFLSEIGSEQASELMEAHRSVKTENGESDLELTYKSPSGLIRLLIENKVDASFQPDQPQRYAERAERYRKTRKYTDVITIVMAPEVYFGDENSTCGFDARVTYEFLLSWFEKSDIGMRKDYKLTILRGAIDRSRKGWKLVPHKGVSHFWKSYWDLSEKIAPQLSMPLPKPEIPADSHFIVFKPASLPEGVSLLHKVGYGHVDLQFAGMGNALLEMEQLYRPYLLQSMRIEKAGKSAVIRLRVEPIDMKTTLFTKAEALVQKGIESASLLLEWFTSIQCSIGDTSSSH